MDKVAELNLNFIMKPNKLSIITFLLSIIFVVSIFFLLLSIYFGNNPLNNSSNSNIKFVSVFPEGWAFFTKSAKEPQLYLFSCDKKVVPINLRNFSSEYYFGISRHNRILNIQIHNVFHEIKDDSIKPFIVNTNNLDSLLNKLSVKNLNCKNLHIENKFAKDLDGKYLFALQLQLPWSLLHQKPKYPHRYVIYPINIIKK